MEHRPIPTDENPILIDGYWHGSDGRTVPFTSGGSDDWAPAVNTDGDGQSDPFEGLSDFGRQYLENVDESVRPVVAEHVKKWDSGYTRQRQKDAEQYKWAREINAEPEYVKNSVNLVRRFETDPIGVIKQMVDGEFITPEQLQGILGGGSAPQTQGQPPQPGSAEIEGLDPRVAAQLEKMLSAKLGPLEKGLGAAATYITTEQQTRQQQTQMAKVEADINKQIEKFGPMLDKDMVLGFMSAGLDAETAAERAIAVTKRAAEASRAPRSPFAMPGSGQAPNFSKDLANPETSDDKVRDYIASLLGGNR